MTPKTHRRHSGLLSKFRAIGAVLGLGLQTHSPQPGKSLVLKNEKPAKVSTPMNDGWHGGVNYQRGTSNGAPFITHMSQKKCRKLNRRSGIYRKRRAKA